MTTYVLIVILYYGHAGFSQEFNSLEKCDVARRMTETMIRSNNTDHISAACVEK